MKEKYKKCSSLFSLFIFVKDFYIYILELQWREYVRKEVFDNNSQRSILCLLNRCEEISV